MCVEKTRAPRSSGAGHTTRATPWDAVKADSAPLMAALYSAVSRIITARLQTKVDSYFPANAARQDASATAGRRGAKYPRWHFPAKREANAMAEVLFPTPPVFGPAPYDYPALEFPSELPPPRSRTPQRQRSSEPADEPPLPRLGVRKMRRFVNDALLLGSGDGVAQRRRAEAAALGARRRLP